MAHKLIPGPSQKNVHKLVQYIAWSPPSDDSWRLNFAGYSTGEENDNGGAGCVLRDQNGIFKVAYAAPLLECGNVIITELAALKIGLEIALGQGVDYLEIEGDYSIVIRMLRGEIIPLSLTVQGLVQQCIYFIAHFRRVRVRQVQILGNEPANKVAIMASQLGKPFQWLNKPPAQISDSLIGDVIGRWVPLPGP